MKTIKHQPNLTTVVQYVQYSFAIMFMSHRAFKKTVR